MRVGIRVTLLKPPPAEKRQMSRSSKQPSETLSHLVGRRVEGERRVVSGEW